jgi:lipoprotein NlpD
MEAVRLRLRLRKWAVGLMWMAACFNVAACSRAGIYHRVQPGENLYRIGKAYGIAYADLAKLNDISNPARIEIGQKIFIPGARRELPVEIITPRGASVRGVTDEPDWRGAPSFAWPVQSGALSSEFGQRGQTFHDGIDVSAPVGTPVSAAADGEVIYSDVLRGYGNVIIIRHGRGFVTVYAHNESNRVREGQRVQQGEVVATVGESGRTTGPNLHFEVRWNNVARDPLLFLPPTEQVALPRGGERGG